MVIYWLMFAYPALMTFVLGDKQRLSLSTKVGVGFLFITFVVIMGLRYDTGADWGVYEENAENQYFSSVNTILADFEPGCNLLTWSSAKLGWSVYGATVFCAIVLMYGILRYARRQPEPWLTITAAVPYLIVVIGMSYIRQAVAIGFILVALVHFEDRRWGRFGLFMVLATLFHASSLIVFLVTAAVTVRKRPLLLAPLAIGAAPAIYFLANRYDNYREIYVDTQSESAGTLIRLFMNLVPALLFLLYRKRFDLKGDMKVLWTVFALLCCVSFVGFALSPSSTIIDRLALYLIPIQLFVFGNLPTAITQKPAEARMISTAGIAYFAVVQFVWLNYAANAWAWLPYKSLLTS